jgi:hydroxymethylpyrimidine/phosphomethylpyrimidine kinase
MPPGAATFAWIGIFKTFVIINIPAENSITVEIVNKGIRDTFKAQFDDVWARAKPFGKK